MIELTTLVSTFVSTWVRVDAGSTVVMKLVAVDTSVDGVSVCVMVTGPWMFVETTVLVNVGPVIVCTEMTELMIVEADSTVVEIELSVIYRVVLTVVV